MSFKIQELVSIKIRMECVNESYECNLIRFHNLIKTRSWDDCVMIAYRSFIPLVGQRNAMVPLI